MGVSSTEGDDIGMTKIVPPKIDLKEVGRRLDALREASGLEKGVFADISGIDRSSYSKIIQGEKPLKAEMAYSLSMRWDVPMDFFYRGSLDRIPSTLSAKIIASLTGRSE